MCLIIYQPPGVDAIPDEHMRRGWEQNHHGAGYMFSHGGKLIIRKAFYKLAELCEAYKADHREFGAASAFVLHFRWATHGDKTAINVHPHAIADGRVGLVHNGVLSQFEPVDFHATISDTVLFCHTVLACREPAQLLSAEFCKMLAAMIGDHNKLVLMDDLGNVQIVNEEAGRWDGSNWYSNGGYLPPEPVKTTSIVSRACSAIAGVARGIVFASDATPAATTANAAALPAAYQERTRDADDDDGWARMRKAYNEDNDDRYNEDWRRYAEDDDDDDIDDDAEDDDVMLQWFIGTDPDTLSEDDWREYAAICHRRADRNADRLSRRDTARESEEWYNEQRMLRAIDRDR